MIATPKQVTRYHVSRKVYPLNSEGEGTSELFTQRRAFFRKLDAYRWVARGGVFRRRDKQGCLLSPKLAHPEDGACCCRYCDEEKWGPVVERLARLLRHYDEKGLIP